MSHRMTEYHITSHHMTSHHTSHITSHHMTAHHTTSHHITWQDMTWYVATNHITSPHVTSQPTTWHTPTSHHQHLRATETQPAATKTSPPDETAEGWCIQKTWFGQCAGWWTCTHSIGKFFLWLIRIGGVFPETSDPRPGTIGTENMILRETSCRGQGFNRSYNAAASSQQAQFDMWRHSRNISNTHKAHSSRSHIKVEKTQVRRDNLAMTGALMRRCARMNLGSPLIRFISLQPIGIQFARPT